MEETQLIRAALCALYGLGSGEVRQVDADGVMFALEEWLVEHDEEWIRQWHELAHAADKDQDARRQFRRELRTKVRPGLGR